MTESKAHIPIMAGAIVDGLEVATHPNALYIDGTLGAGGHSHAILAGRSDNRLLGIDRDPQALALAQQTLAEFGQRVQIHHANYLEMEDLAQGWLGIAMPQVDGIVLDLGLSSLQLDTAERGFAFRHSAPLDMRFDPGSDDPTAADLVNGLPEQDLANLLYTYGEEKLSRKIARAIVSHRPIETTIQLAELVAQVYGPTRERIHPATRTFQALRIAVNRELDAVEAVLPLATRLLKPGGRLAVISFHSLEDRLVKHYFKQESSDCLCPPRQPVCTCGHVASLTLITRKPMTADEAEIAQNPRARSAKLRIVQKLG
jgi:16S rRNA (cytosine1402-N4)-methyltransferase